jgi:hypothetical protein
MVQIGANDNPIRFPRTHTAKNIGENTFSEILFESKTKCINNQRNEYSQDL